MFSFYQVINGLMQYIKEGQLYNNITSFLWNDISSTQSPYNWLNVLGTLTYCLFVCFWRDSPQWARASSFTRFLDHTQRRNKVGRTSLDE